MHRRRFIQAGSAVAGLLATGTIAACGSDDEPAAETSGTEPPEPTASTEGATDDTTATTEPAEESATTEPASTEGGTVRVGMISSPADTLDPASTTGLLEYATLFAIHDSLVLLKGDQFELQLAESIEPNADGSEWTIVLREGPTFTNGNPVTAADVVYSINHYGTSPNYGQFFALIDLPNVAVIDDRTVSVPMVTPRADLIETIFGQLSIVMPEGFTDWGNNVGSGPFILEQFEQGVGATLTRNPNYWAGAPSIERVEFTAITEASTRARALSSGEVEYVGSLDAAAAESLGDTDGVSVIRGGGVNSTIRCFAFNQTQAPFDNPDVIEACKLAADRQQLIDVIAFGNAELGNDMPSLGFEGYPVGVEQRERDVARATELFAAAGVTEFTIVAADFVPGIVASAELYAQQLAECGVTATVEVGDPLTYFNDFAQVLSTPCQSFYFINRPPETLLSSYTGSNSAFNVFGSGNPEYDAALNEALSTVDAVSRKEQITELLQTVRDEEGWLIWGFEDQIDASVDGLTGVDLTQSVPVFNNATLTT
ncbi:MAG: ABC transporter substrate-binding protein [Actinomycetota bacterium]